MKVLGLDLSLTSTGCANIHGDTYRLTTSLRGVQRLLWFRDQIHQLATSPARPDLVVIEDYAYSARAAHSHELGELGGIVRLALHDRKIPWVPVVPTALKKYSTGRGNAKKDEVFAAAIRRLGYTGNSHDEADALWLRAMGLDHYGFPAATVPATHRDTLHKIAWPDLQLLDEVAS